MTSYIWRQLKARLGRTTLTLLSIVIGVAAVVSMTAATATTKQAYRTMYASLTGRADVEVVAEGGGSFDEKLAASLQAAPGVQDIVPVVLRPTVMYLEGQKTQLIVVGIDPERVQVVHDYALEAGHFPSLPGEVMVAAQFAKSVGLTVDDEVKLLTRKGVKRLTIAGLVAPRSTAAGNVSTMLFAELHDAQELFGRTGEIDALQIVFSEHADPAEFKRELAARLPPNLRLRNPLARTELSMEEIRATETGLFFASALTLELAVVVILNTFFMNVTERRRQLAMLRMIGATRRQIMLALLGEGLALGTLGSLLGLPLGLGGGYALSAAMAHMLQRGIPALQFSHTSLIAAALTGPIVALVGTIAPAFKASRVPPLEALSGVDRTDEVTHTRAAALLGLLLLTIGSACFAAFWFGRLSSEVVIPAAAVALIGLSFVMSALLGFVVRLLGTVLGRMNLAEAQLACAQLLRRRGRSALTIGVLFVALSTSIGIANTILNDLDDSRTWFRRTMAADFFISVTFPDPTNGMAAGMSKSLGDEIAALQGVTGVDTMRFLNARVDGKPVVALIREYSRRERVPMNLLEGNDDEVRTRMAQGEVAIGLALSERTGKKVGDTLVLDSPDGPQTCRIAGIVNEYLVGGVVVCLDRPVAERLLHVEGADAFFVHVDPSQLQSSEAALTAMCDDKGLLLHSYRAFSAQFDSMMAGVVGSLWVLLVLAMAVAASGIVNTMSMNVLEQTREIGLLRIVAMTQRQVRRTILAQASILGLIGLLPGALAGIGVAWLVNLSIAPMIGRKLDFSIPPLLVIGAFTVSFAMVLIAALGPAKFAARLKLSEALQYE